MAFFRDLVDIPVEWILMRGLVCLTAPMGVHTHVDFLYAMLDITGFGGFMKWLVETLLYACLGLVIGSLIAVLRQARTTYS